MHEKNTHFAPKSSMDENFMHKIEHSPISNDIFMGKKSSKEVFGANFHAWKYYFHAWKYYFHA